MFSCYENAARVASFDAMSDVNANNYLGTRSLQENLRFIPDMVDGPLRLPAVSADGFDRVFRDVEEALPSAVHKSKMREMVERRWAWLLESGVVALLAEGRGACSHDDFVLRGPYDLSASGKAPDRRAALRAAVGSAVADARRCRGLTQAQLAERACVDQAVVSRVEQGRANLTLDLLADLAVALGADVEVALKKASGQVVTK